MSEPNRQESLHEAMARLTAAAELPADLTGQPGRFRRATLIWAAVFVGFVALGFTTNALIVSVVFGVISGTVALWLAVVDLTIPPARDRRTSTKAVRSYFNAIRRNRWDTAFAALSPLAHDRTVRVPNIAALQTVPADHILLSPGRVKQYWLTITRPHGKLTRRISRLNIVPVTTEGAIHRHRVELNITYYPTWVVISVLLGVLPAILIIWATQNTYKTSFEVVTFKYKSQWHLLTGELCSPVEGNAPDAQPLPRATLHKRR